MLFSVWTSVRLSFSLVAVCLLLSRVVSSLSTSDPSLIPILTDLLITVYFLVSTAIHIGSAVLFRKAAVSLRDSLMQVIAGGKQLHDLVS